MKYLSILILIVSQAVNGQSILLLDDFESGIPLYFTLVDNDGFTPNSAVSEYASAWISKVDPDDASNKVASATSFFSPAGIADRWLITPQLNLGAFGNFFSWQGKSHDASFPESYLVMLSKTDNQLASFTDTIEVVINETEYWTTHTLNLSELGYDNESVRLAINLRSYDAFKLYIDSMKVWKDDPVSVKELQLNGADFSVAPNPTSDMLSISSQQHIDWVKLIGLNGMVILETTASTLFLSNLSSGVYIIEVKTDEGTGRKRIVKN